MADTDQSHVTRPAAEKPIAPDAESPEKKPLPEKTNGERFYDVFQFIYGKAFIIVLTAALGFLADQKHAPDKIAGIPNIVKKFQGWFHNVVFHNKVYPIAQKGDTAKLIGTGLVSTMVLSHGGNFFAPAIKSLENNREKIANWYNKRFGTKEDVEAAHERLKDIPKQTWGDVLKGRAVAWGTMFGLVMTAYVAVGKQKKSGRYWLDIYEDKFARMASGLTKSGKEIAATPIAKELTEVQKANKTYRFSKILALDIFTTTSAIMIWNSVSRFLAKKRVEREKIAAHHERILTGEDQHHTPAQSVATEPEAEKADEKMMVHDARGAPKDGAVQAHQDTHKHRQKVEPKGAIKPSLADGYADMVEQSDIDASHALGA